MAMLKVTSMFHVHLILSLQVPQYWRQGTVPGRASLLPCFLVGSCGGSCQKHGAHTLVCVFSNLPSQMVPASVMSPGLPLVCTAIVHLADWGHLEQRATRHC
jgi:hypothetical protein